MVRWGLKALTACASVLYAAILGPGYAQERAAVQSRFADVNGIQLHYLVAGKGDP